MADSETSRTLPSITRRNLLSTTADILWTLPKGPRPESSASNLEKYGSDPALVCWQQWAIAQERFIQFSESQSRLEKVLAQEVSPPHVMVQVAKRPTPVFVETDEEIHRLMKGPEYEAARASASLELATRRAAWTVADNRIGYSTAKRAEEEAGDLSAQLSQQVLDVPAHSVAGAVAKLHVVITDGEPGPENVEFPWPQLRSILLDLLHTLASPAVTK